MKKIKGLSTHLNRLLVVYFNTYMIVAVASFVMTAITRDPVDLAKMHVMMVLPLYLYIVRSTIRHLIPFTLAHLLAGVVMLVYYYPVMNLFGMVIIGLGTFIFIFHSFAARLVDLKNETTFGGIMVTCGVFVVGYFASGVDVIQNASIMQPYLMTASAVMIVLYFIDMHSKNINSTLNNVNEMLNQPAQKIRKFNNKILVYFMIGTAIFVVLALIFKVDRAIVAMGQLILMIIRFLVSLIPKKEPEPGDSTIEEEVIQNNNEDMGELPAAEASPFWEFLEIIMTVAVFVFLICLIIYGLYRFYKWFYSRQLDVVTADEFEETSVYMEKQEKVERKKETLWERLRLSNEKKVRRIYKKRLDAPMKKQELIKISDAPGEILEKMPSEELAALTKVYEKARYSQEPVSKEELKSVGG